MGEQRRSRSWSSSRSCSAWPRCASARRRRSRPTRRSPARACAGRAAPACCDGTSLVTSDWTGVCVSATQPSTASSSADRQHAPGPPRRGRRPPGGRRHRAARRDPAGAGVGHDLPRPARRRADDAERLGARRAARLRRAARDRAAPAQHHRRRAGGQRAAERDRDPDDQQHAEAAHHRHRREQQRQEAGRRGQRGGRDRRRRARSSRARTHPALALEPRRLLRHAPGTGSRSRRPARSGSAAPRSRPSSATRRAARRRRT